MVSAVNIHNRPIYFRFSFAYAVFAMHKVYMSFFLRQRWHVGFLKSDLKTPLRRKLAFQDSVKLIELVERGGGFQDQEHRMMMERDIDKGRGGIYLRLTDEQYKQLL